MRRVIVFVVILWFETIPIGGQEQRQIFLSITGPSGVPVPTLQTSDVTVLEDDTECHTVQIEPINWPMKLTVIVDNGPQTGTYLTELRNGLRSFFMRVPGDVEVSLQTLAPQPRWVVKPTSDHQQVIDGINLIVPDNRAGQFFDALAEAGNRMEKDKAAFPVIMLFMTDLGGGSVREQQIDRLRKQVAEHAATVHVILLSLGTQASRGNPGQPTAAGGRGGSGGPGARGAQGGQRGQGAQRGIPPGGGPAGEPTQGLGLPREFGFVRGGLQTQVGLTLTQLSGGRYETIAAANRVVTLLPEYAQQIARSDALQSHNVRVTYERPAGVKGRPQRITARFAREGFSIAAMSLDGHLP